MVYLFHNFGVQTNICWLAVQAEFLLKQTCHLSRTVPVLVVATHQILAEIPEVFAGLVT